jgi:hypothetical protein
VVTLTISSPEVWDRTRRARVKVDRLTLRDVAEVLDAHDGAYVAVETDVEDSMSGVDRLTARGHLCRDRTYDDPDDDLEIPLTLYYDLEWAGKRVGRFAIDELYFVGATLLGESATDCAGLFITQDVCRLGATGQLPSHRLLLIVWFDRVIEEG